jgi:hypothetical protein
MAGVGPRRGSPRRARAERERLARAVAIAGSAGLSGRIGAIAAAIRGCAVVAREAVVLVRERAARRSLVAAGDRAARSVVATVADRGDVAVGAGRRRRGARAGDGAALWRLPGVRAQVSDLVAPREALRPSLCVGRARALGGRHRQLISVAVAASPHAIGERPRQAVLRTAGDLAARHPQPARAVGAREALQAIAIGGAGELGAAGRAGIGIRWHARSEESESEHDRGPHAVRVQRAS